MSQRCETHERYAAVRKDAWVRRAMRPSVPVGLSHDLRIHPHTSTHGKNQGLTYEHSHLFTDAGVLLEQDIDVDVFVRGCDAPNHAANDLVERRQALDPGTEVPSCEEQLQRRDTHKREGHEEREMGGEGGSIDGERPAVR